MNKAVLVLFVLAAVSFAYSEGREFKCGRVKFSCKEADAQEKWDHDKKSYETFMEHLERYTTLKVDKAWNVVSLDKLDDLIKYPILFMTASGTPDLSDLEIKNLKEYLDRGGFLFIDDYNWPARGGNIFAEGMRHILEKAYPKNRVVPMELDHELLRSHFDIPLGYFSKLWFGKRGTPSEEKSVSGIWILSDDKGRAMVFFTILLQGTWGGVYWRPEKQEDAIKMGINIVMYSLTH